MIAFLASPVIQLNPLQIIQYILSKQQPYAELQLYIMDDAGEKTQRINKSVLPENIDTLIWSPDGQELIASSGSKLYRIERDSLHISLVSFSPMHQAAITVIDWQEGDKLIMTYRLAHETYWYSMSLSRGTSTLLAHAPTTVIKSYNSYGQVMIDPHTKALFYDAPHMTDPQRLESHHTALQLTVSGLPVWSPDGRFLALPCQGPYTEQLYVLSCDPFELVLLGAIAFESPLVWSSDSTQLAYIVPEASQSVLAVNTPRNPGALLLTALESGSADGALHSVLTWAADQQHLVYGHMSDIRHDLHVYKVNIATRHQVQLTTASYALITRIVCA